MNTEKQTRPWLRLGTSVLAAGGLALSALGLASGTAQALENVWGLDATHVWAVGDSGTILFWNGISWSAQSSGTTQTLNGVWGVDNSHVWAVGSGGSLLFWNGSFWASLTSGTTSTLPGIGATSPLGADFGQVLGALPGRSIQLSAKYRF